MAAALHGLEFTGLRELNTALKKIGVTDAAVKAAMQESGGLVLNEAYRIMPTVSGKLASTLKVTGGKNKLVVQVGNNTTAQYGYTFHATELGKSKGGFTFHVAAHTRRGHPVRAYTAQRRIPNRPFLFDAWDRKQREVFESYVKHMDDLLREFGNA